MKRNPKAAELDLHGCTVDEALSMFVEFYNGHLRSGSDESLRVIHGFGGTGKIRQKLRVFLETVDDRLDWKPGEALEGKPALTIIWPRRLLPIPGDRLLDDVLAYCSTPRTESKI